MGTRSLTNIYAQHDQEIEAELLCTIYRQFDGHPSGMGQDIADFSRTLKIVNGIAVGDNSPQANGAGCYAAQLISHLKKDQVGNVYLYKPGATDCGEEYIYNITVIEPRTFGLSGSIGLEVIAVYLDAIIFSGPIENFDAEKVEARERAMDEQE